jgi:hypothetical protein
MINTRLTKTDEKLDQIQACIMAKPCALHEEQIRTVQEDCKAIKADQSMFKRWIPWIIVSLLSGSTGGLASKILGGEDFTQQPTSKIEKDISPK